jgi:hypothetical protein
MDKLLISILTALGLTDIAETIKKGDATEIEKLKAEEIVSEAIDVQKELLASDEDFTKPIKSEAQRAVLMKRQDVFQKLHSDILTKEIVESFPESERLDRMMKYVATHKKKDASADDKDKKIDELNAELLKKDEIIADYENVKLPGVRSEMEGKMTQREIDTYLRNQFRGLESRLVADAELLYPGIETELKKKFDFKREDDGSVILLEKGKTTKATKNSKPYLIGSAFEDIAEDKKAIKKSEPLPDKEKLKEKGAGDKKFDLTGNTKFNEALERKKKETEEAAK